MFICAVLSLYVLFFFSRYWLIRRIRPQYSLIPLVCLTFLWMSLLERGLYCFIDPMGGKQIIPRGYRRVLLTLSVPWTYASTLLLTFFWSEAISNHQKNQRIQEEEEKKKKRNKNRNKIMILQQPTLGVCAMSLPYPSPSSHPTDQITKITNKTGKTARETEGATEEEGEEITAENWSAEKSKHQQQEEGQEEQSEIIAELSDINYEESIARRGEEEEEEIDRMDHRMMIGEIEMEILPDVIEIHTHQQENDGTNISISQHMDGIIHSDEEEDEGRREEEKENHIAHQPQSHLTEIDVTDETGSISATDDLMVDVCDDDDVVEVNKHPSHSSPTSSPPIQKPIPSPSKMTNNNSNKCSPSNSSLLVLPTAVAVAAATSSYSSSFSPSSSSSSNQHQNRNKSRSSQDEPIQFLSRYKRIFIMSAISFAAIDLTFSTLDSLYIMNWQFQPIVVIGFAAIGACIAIMYFSVAIRVIRKFQVRFRS